MRPVLLVMVTVNVVASALWISSIWVEYPRRYAVLWIAIAIGIPSHELYNE
jgi:hypothetical protein